MTRGSRFDAALKRQLNELPDWCVAWLEEIFADVYGAAVGGPIMALGFESLLTDDPYADFIKDDGEHPVAALRPFIYHWVFQKQGNNGVEVDILKARWEKWQKEFGKPESFTPHEQKDAVKLGDAKTAIESVLQALWESDLAGLQPNRRLWSEPLTTGDDATRLHELFAQGWQNLTDEEIAVVPELTVATAESTRSVDGDTENTVSELRLHHPQTNMTPPAGQTRSIDGAGKGRRVGDTGLWIDAIKASNAPFNMPPDVWMSLLDGSGWAVEGPGGGVAH